MIKLFEKLYKGTQDRLFNELRNCLLNETKRFIITANPEIFMKSKNDERIYNILMQQDVLITPDGEGVVKAARMLSYEVWGKIAGVDTVQFLLQEAAVNSKKIYVFGCKQDVLDAFSLKYREKYPNINFVGLKNGYTNQSDDVFLDIQDKQPDLILVALGVPKQEIIIANYIQKFKKGIFIGVGGSIDVLSGTVKRAPKILVKCKLEWLYRIFFHPDRWKRFYESNIKFIFVIRQYVKKNK